MTKNKDGEWLRDAGPVTLGQRLDSSHFPDGYESISYERGTWLFHMLRSMLNDSETASHSRKGRANPPLNSDEPFFRALRKARERYAGKSISTQELMQVFEEELPRPLWYENRRKLDWFLEGWIEGTAIPELETRDIRITDKPGGTTVTGVIVQKDAPDDLVTAVPVYAATGSNALVFLGQVLADGAETTFRLVRSKRRAQDRAGSETDSSHRAKVDSQHIPGVIPNISLTIARRSPWCGAHHFSSVRQGHANAHSRFTSNCEDAMTLQPHAYTTIHPPQTAAKTKRPAPPPHHPSGRRRALRPRSNARHPRARRLRSSPSRGCARGHAGLRTTPPALPVAIDLVAIDLVMTDMVLPGRTGLELGEDLRQRSPELVVLVTSGYNNPEYDTESPESRTYFLAKPYSRRTLLEKIEKILGAAPQPQALPLYLKRRATQAG